MTDALGLLIYTEASPQIGHGHVMRCAALAAEARRRGLRVGFVSDDEYTIRLLRDIGEDARRDPPWPSMYVIRDFRDGSSKEAVRLHQDQGARVLLLDDLTSARVVADVVCDALMTENRVARYPHGHDVTYLYGLDYVALRAEFAAARAGCESRPPSAGQRLLVSFGGADSRGIAPRFVEALSLAGYRGPATIVADPAHRAEIGTIVSEWTDTVVTTSIANMAEAILEAGLVATKLGLTVVESFSLGKTCVLVEPTPAHVELAGLLQDAYADWPAIDYGLESEVMFSETAQATIALLEDSQRRSKMGRAGWSLVDGLGTARILDALVDAND